MTISKILRQARDLGAVQLDLAERYVCVRPADEDWLRWVRRPDGWQLHGSVLPPWPPPEPPRH